jgi:hypothetical protein
MLATGAINNLDEALRRGGIGSAGARPATSTSPPAPRAGVQHPASTSLEGKTPPRGRCVSSRRPLAAARSEGPIRLHFRM